jgi:co-chaperonin GroES (HSP10)
MKKFQVLGPRLLVKPFKLEEVDELYKRIKAAGLHVPEMDEKRREQAAIDEGMVISVGSLAWKDWGDGTQWVKEGDKVMWARHAGRTVDYDEKSGDTLVILNDEDIICKVDGE